MRLTNRRKAVGVSLLFHAALLCVLLVWYVPRRDRIGTRGVEPVPAVSSSADAPGTDAERDPAQAPPPQESEVRPEEIQASLDAQLKQVQRLPDETKLSELEKNLKRLESVADSESVVVASETIAGSLGLDTQRYQRSDDEPVPGPFHIGSAQIDSVSRAEDNKGQFRYRAVMLDAEGRTMEVSLGDAEGEKLYETFQLIERYPMAKGIYQSVVMPMMQEMLQPADSGRSGASQPELTPQDDP